MYTANLFQRTLNLQCPPTQALQGEDADSLDTLLAIADLNFSAIDNFIDGDLANDPHFYTEREDRTASITRILALLHNYLAGIYSYNETVTNLLPEYLPSDVSDPITAEFAGLSHGNTSQYARRFNFLLGLRTDAQHGSFSGIQVTGENVSGSRSRHHVKFDRRGFVDSTRLDSMNHYLRHTNRREREYVLSFIARFHRHTLQRFHDDLLEWFGWYGR